MKASSLSLKLFLTLAFLMGIAKPDPDPLQDYCIADLKPDKSLFVNGAPCVDPARATSAHFATSALSKPGNTSNPLGFSVTLTNTKNLPGLNTQGLTLARVDLAANGIVPAHSHPRASEVTTCLVGSILVGFVNTSNYLYTQTLGPGESFVFPRGLVHFLYNNDPEKPALALSGLSSQNPGAQLVSTTTSVSEPAVNDEVLKRLFRISNHEVAITRENLGGR